MIEIYHNQFWSASTMLFFGLLDFKWIVYIITNVFIVS